jgi:diguanylate cyclase (GGDEF)-like protein
MDTRPLILACDHRDGTLARKLAAPARGSVRPGPPLTDARIEVSASLRESLERLGRERPEVLVIDPLTPGGLAELGALASTGGDQLPVLLVGEHGDASVLVNRVEGSVPWDLIDRRAHPGEFRLRLERLLRDARLRREVGELRHRASHDDRTDLLRPQAFQDLLQGQFSAALEVGASLALIMVDLDDFGSINKRYDHTVGDAVIERVGGAVRRTLRLEDFAGRLGGDEFAVLLPYAGAPEATRVSERLKDGIVRLSGRWPEFGADLTLSGSFGWAVFDGLQPPSVGDLRLAAERALREAKRRGGNQAVGAHELVVHTSNGSPKAE